MSNLRLALRADARSTLGSPKVKYSLIGVGALILLLIVRKIFR